MNALVIGGAGYIGGTTTHLLLKAGHKVFVLDNLSTGHAANVPKEAELIEGDMGDSLVVSKILKDHQIDIVLHFAAMIRADESMQKPMTYFENNSVAALRLIDTIINAGVKNYIFSSTAAVYGTPKDSKVTEDTPISPENPYGFSKRVTELFLNSYGLTDDVNWLALRYFNAAGAHGEIGPDYPFRSHLIPILVDCFLEGKTFTVNGTDFDTPDGSAVRDYVHVEDIARAHVLAAEKMMTDEEFKTIINLGTEKGSSVKQVIKALEEIVDSEINFKEGPRRSGDPAAYYANATKAKEMLGWQAEKDLHQILQDALDWQIAKNNE